MKVNDLQRASAPPSPSQLAEGFLGDHETRIRAEISEIHELLERVDRLLLIKNDELARLRAENQRLKEAR